MPLSRRAALLERLGIRRWYRVMSWLTGDRMMTVGAPPDRTRADLVELRRNARYYSWANFWRGALYVPPVIALFRWEAWGGFGLLLFLVIFHYLCYELEFYRTSMAEVLEECGQYLEHAAGPKVEQRTIGASDPTSHSHDDPDEPLRMEPHWFFWPKRFESETFYRLIGMEKVRQIVVYYTDKTKLTPEERKAGTTVSFVSGKPLDLVDFEKGTRTGEKLHVTAALFNIYPLYECLDRAAFGWAFYLSLILIIDISLSLLQRYHRVRVHRLWERTQRKSQKSTS
jgi:hypothetical protein